jgi:hypothetical protein
VSYHRNISTSGNGESITAEAYRQGRANTTAHAKTIKIPETGPPGKLYFPKVAKQAPQRRIIKTEGNKETRRNEPGFVVNYSIPNLDLTPLSSIF